MGDTPGKFASCKENSLGFTIIELMLVIAVVSILAIVTVPKFQGLTDHYHLESSAQVVAGQIRNAKQYAMDRREPIYVKFDTSTKNTVQLFYKDKLNNYLPLNTPQEFDSGITFDSSQSSGLDISTPSSQGLSFDRKGFHAGNLVKIALTNTRTPPRVVYVNLTPASLEVKFTWP